MAKIAVLIDKEGMTISIKEKGSVRIFEKNGDSWAIIDEIPCSINFSSGLSEVRKELTELLQKIKDCKIFVATEISGQLYYLLESYGYSSYQIDGKPELYLESVLQAETAEMNRIITEKDIPTSEIKPEPTGDPGVYSINLRKALAMNLDTSSKKILKPFLQENKFEVLEVICDHVPRWFEPDLKAIGFDITILNLCENEYKVIIMRK